MPVNILNTTYQTQFKPTSTTNWLLGNIGDWQKLTMDVEFVVEKLFTPTDTVTLEDPNKLILNGGENWKDLGFDVGMDCTLFFIVRVWTGGVASDISNFIHFTITGLLGDTLEMVKLSGAPQSTWGYQYGQIAPVNASEDTDIISARVFTNVQIQGFKMEASHIKNSAIPSGNTASIIDGTTAGFVMEDTDTMAIGVPADFTHQLNFKSGLSVEKATVEYLGAAGRRYNYRVVLIFMIASEADITNFLDEIAPDSMKGAAAITDIFQFTGYPVYNNPNITIKNNPKLTTQKGNTGWFDENFNQLPNLFTHTDVVYTNLSGTVVSQLDHVNPIVMTTTISGIPNLTGATRFQYGFRWIPLDEEVYQETEYPYHKNVKVSTGGQAASMTDVFPLSSLVNLPLRSGYSQDGLSGMDASHISFVQNGTDVDVSIRFVPSAGFAAFMEELNEDERQYVLWVSVGDQAPSSNQTDRVSLRLDVNKMNTFVEPIGPWAGMAIDFLDHPQDSTDIPILCGNSIYIEDDLEATIIFLVDTATGPAIPIPTKITFGVLVEQDITGTQYLLDTTDVDLSTFPDPTQYNYDVPRDFKLGIGNPKNNLKVNYNAAADTGTEKGVLGQYGFKVRWEDWLQRFNAPTDFYDNTELNNGKNNDWFHYFEVSGWKLYFYVNITTQLGVYQNTKQMTVLDYDVNTTISTVLNYYRDNAGVKGALLNGGTDGVIIENEFVWLDIEYTSTVPVADWANQATVDANVYATQCIEPDKGAGQKEFRQLSSIWVSEFDNPMVGIISETLAKVTFVSTTKIIVETRIESNKLINSPRYKITGRIGCK